MIDAASFTAIAAWPGWKWVTPTKRSPISMRRSASNRPKVSISTTAGEPLHKSGRYREGRADLLEAIRLSPKFANPHKNLAWLLRVALIPEFATGKAVEPQNALRLTAEKNIDWFEIAAAAYAEAGTSPKR